MFAFPKEYCVTKCEMFHLILHISLPGKNQGREETQQETESSVIQYGGDDTGGL